MSNFQIRISSFLCGVLSLIICAGVEARVSIIVSAPPLAREIMVEPAGYTSCYMAEPRFYNGIWMYEHRVCEYEQDSGVRVWVAGYWQCTHYQSRGLCTRKAWIKDHWAIRTDREYREPRYYEDRVRIREQDMGANVQPRYGHHNR